MKGNPNERFSFYGIVQNPITIRLEKMDLAILGLEWNIAHQSRVLANQLVK